MHAYGADCMQEYGKVVILGKSVEEESYSAKSVPWKSTGWLHKRMRVQDMEAIVEALSPTTAQVSEQVTNLYHNKYYAWGGSLLDL